MFYLTKRVDEKQCLVGEECMVLSDFSGIPAGMKGIITEIYSEGVMITWIKDGKTAEDIIAALDVEMVAASRGFLSDGFSRDELEYLAFATQKHPKVDPAVYRHA